MKVSPRSAASLCAALSVESLWAWRLPWLRRTVEFGPAMTLLLGVYLAAYAASLMPSTIRFLETLNAREQQTLADISLVSSSGHGRAACETMELCYWGKSEFTVDIFDFGPVSYTHLDVYKRQRLYRST